MASSVCAGGGAVATVLGAKCLSRIAEHRWFERRLVLADGGELRQEVRVDVRVEEEAGPGEESLT